MEASNRNIFWEALILAIFIFASGILLGYLMESSRTGKIISLYQQSELDMLDIKIQESIFSLQSINCDSFLNETINFADRIYDEAKMLQDYEGSSKLTSGIILQHKKYDLLRALLLANSIKLNERCPNKIKLVVYFYEYNPENMDKESLQKVFSKKLEETKAKFGNSIILIPIAGNLNINSINYLLKQYNIESLPTVFIKNNTKLTTIEQLNNIENYLE